MVRNVSVVIPVRDGALSLRDAVECVQKQRDVAVTEILVAVAPSGDETEAIARSLADEFVEVRVLDNPTGGISSGLNVGMRAASNDVLVRVDARSFLEPNHVSNALELMVSKGAVNVGSVQVPTGVTKTERAIAAAMRHRLGSGGARYRSSDGGARKVDTAFLGVFDLAALREVGGWDEAWLRNEDAELNLRLQKAGGEVWLDDRLHVEYRPRSTLAGLARQYWDYGRWRMRTIRRHKQSVRLRQVAAPVIVVCCAASFIGALMVSPWLGLVAAAYVIAIVGVGATTTELTLGERFTMSAALATMHLSWGSGFLASLLTR